VVTPEEAPVVTTEQDSVESPSTLEDPRDNLVQVTVVSETTESDD